MRINLKNNSIFGLGIEQIIEFWNCGRKVAIFIDNLTKKLDEHGVKKRGNNRERPENIDIKSAKKREHQDNGDKEH